MAILRALVLAAILLATTASAAGPDEYQVKAVFLFNFTRFVEWPASAFTTQQAPFVICVLGHDPFRGRLQETVSGEALDGHPFEVRQVRTPAEARECRILFIPESESSRLDELATALRGSGTLTVGERDDPHPGGAMIRLVTDRKRIRMRIDVHAARDAGLTISSKLLRSAEIVQASGDAT
jgi:hypothetical protein